MKEKKVASFLFKTSRIIFKSLAIIGFMVGAGEVGMSQTNASFGVRNILLVHGIGKEKKTIDWRLRRAVIKLKFTLYPGSETWLGSPFA
jgi:hypothetical protein